VTDVIERALTDRRAFVVRFRDLERWDVASYRRIAWRWSEGVLRSIGDVLRRKRREIDTTLDLANVPIIAKVSFGGEIFIRPPEQRSGYKGRLYWANPGDLIYSKIRVKQGSISVVPEEFEHIAVSPEYPVYEVDHEQLDGAYLQLVVRSRPFLQYLDGLAHGGATKTRIPPELFESVKVPVPPLADQRAIVTVWNDAQAEADTIRQRASDAESQTETDFLHALGLTRPRRVERPHAFAVQWSEMERWNVRYNQLAGTSADLNKGTYPVCALGDHLNLAQYGTSKKANSRKQGIPVLRINNIKDGRLDTADLKHVTLAASELHSLALQKGDILIIRTSGSRDLVGTCAVFDEDDTYVHASYLIRLRFDPSCVESRFAAYFLNSTLGRQQVNALSRHIMMNNINAAELRRLRLPLPPPSIQSILVNAVEASREHARTLRVEADRRLSSARCDVEAMILGTTPIPTE
jgi:type I restriction enzyme, S subunit